MNLKIKNQNLFILGGHIVLIWNIPIYLSAQHQGMSWQI